MNRIFFKSRREKRQFTGEIQPDTTNRTTTEYSQTVNAALRKDIFTLQVTTSGGPYTRCIFTQLITNPNTRWTLTSNPVGNTENKKLANPDRQFEIYWAARKTLRGSTTQVSPYRVKVQ